MKRIFIDLEMNKVSWEFTDVRKICAFEVIQIGAVKLDEKNNEIDVFNEYVRPKYSRSMNKMIEKLTGIHFEQLAKAECLELVLNRFYEWCGEDFEIYSWSFTDRIQLENEFRLKKIATNNKMKDSFSKWHDFQADFGSYFPFENPMGLKMAVELAGVDYSGAAHDGLNDARSAAEVFIMTQTEDRFRNFEERVLECFSAKKCTIGDMLDFSIIQCA